ncbi:MAG: hypothetical protein CV087_08675 [Candidatus Brocadia sp. WS118]|nr:MAG: hypothetical protein CV087_08675 [Candidatus Brocadia sp. WS118]
MLAFLKTLKNYLPISRKQGVTFSMTVSGNLLSGLTDYSREEVIKDIAFEIGKQAEYKALCYFKNGRNYQYEL